MKEKYQIKAFNGVFISYCLIFIAFYLFVYQFIIDLDLETRKRIVSGFSLFTLLIFVFYKRCLAKDEEYSKINEEAGLGKFNILNELPFQLCNINLFLIPIGIHFSLRYLLGMSLFTGTIGALLAMLLPCTGFDHYSIFKPRILYFYLTHTNLVMVSISLLTMDIYKPELKDVVPISLCLLAVSLLAHLLNLFLVKSKLCENANYFYTMNPDNIAPFLWIQKYIPYPFLYELPFIGLFTILIWLLIFFINII